jgi:hypothetical protein
MKKKKRFELFNEYMTIKEEEINNEIMKIIVNKEEMIIDTKKLREENKIIEKMIEIIGESIILYNSILHFNRTLFIKTNNEYFCNFRFDILMTFYEYKVKNIYDSDPCQKFSWYIDAWIRSLPNLISNRLIDINFYLKNFNLKRLIFGFFFI